MKTSRLYLIFAGSVFLLSSLAMLVSTFALYRAVDRGGAGVPTEAKVAAAVATFSEQVRSARDPEAAKRALRSLEASLGIRSDSRQMERVKAAFGPVLEQVMAKPREADDHHLAIKKRDIMEYSINFYRKEVQNGDLTVRTHLVNLMFDTQNSFLNESLESEKVYIAKSKDKIAALHKVAPGYKDGTLSYRISNLEALVLALEKSVTAASVWNEKLAESLAAAGKSTERIVQDLRRDGETAVEDSQREFLYTSVMAVLMFLLSGMVVFFGYRLIRSRFEIRSEVAMRWMRGFGRERDDQSIRREMESLSTDEDWGGLVAGMFSAEETFLQTHGAEAALAKNVTMPFLVFTRDRVAEVINDEARDLLGLGSAGVSFDEVMCASKLSSTEGWGEATLDALRQSFNIPRSDVFEMRVCRDGTYTPVEIHSSPILKGPLAGGKIYLFREIRSEAERVNRAVEHQIGYLRDVVHKVTHFYPIEVQVRDDVTPPLKEMLSDLRDMKVKLDEREALWKSETGALSDQVDRQKEILQRMGDELEQIQAGHEQLADLVDEMYRADSMVADEIRTLEKELSRWSEKRGRLQDELTRHSAVMTRAKEYEAAIRGETSAIRALLANVEEEFRGLAQFRDEIRLASVNLQLATDSERSEFTSRARSFASRVGVTSEKMRELIRAVEQFVERHPGGSLLSVLEASAIPEGEVAGLSDDHVRLEQVLAKWRTTGSSVLESGERARELIREMEKSDARAHQLGETSVVINDQARQNLQRWN